MTTLEPITDREYLYTLASTDGLKELLTKEESIAIVDKTYYMGWYVLVDEVRKGAIIIMQIGDRYILEAFKDTDQGLTGMKVSVDAGSMVLDLMEEITDVMYAYAREKDYPVQRLILKLGFKYLEELKTDRGNLYVYKKELN